MPNTLDATDRQIIRLLQGNGRMSNVDIAREIGAAEATVRKRLERLINEGIIRITASVNLEQVGLDTMALIGLQVDLARIGGIAERLTGMPCVRSVYYTTGEYDLFVQAVFVSNQDLLHFLTDDLAAIEGIRKISTWHVLKRIQEVYHWRLPAPRLPGILVVDDDPDFLQIARIVLEAEGMAVQTASSGDEALNILHTHKPALVIMDVMMKGVLDGLNASWQIQTDPELRQVPVLMVSSIANSEYADMFPTEGDFPAASFLSKPIPPEKLVKEVHRLLKKFARS